MWFIILLAALSTALAAQENRPVLVLTSYSSSFETFPHQIGVINRVLTGAEVPYELYSLDTKRYPTGAMRERLDERARDWVAERRPYRAVLTADDNALDFVVEHRESLFSGVPVVFFGVNDQAKALRLDSAPLMTGVVERPSIEKTLDLMRRLFPDRQRLVAISDATVSGKADLQTFEALTEDQEDTATWSLREMSHDALRARLSALDGRNAYLLLSPYTDVAGTTLSFDEAVDALQQAAPESPFFHLWRHGVGDGLVGGKVVSHEAQAELATDALLRILSGTDPGDIPVVEESPNRVLFDYEVLERFGVPFWRIPTDARLLNAPLLLRGAFWREVLIVLSVAIPFAVVAWVLRSASSHYHALFHESTSVMLLLDPTTWRVKSANGAAAEYYGYSRRELKRLRINDLVARSPEHTHSAMVAAKHGESRRFFRSQHRLADGRVRDVEVYSGPIRRRRALRLYAIVHDVTARIEAERNLEEAKQAAEAANRAKSQFVAHVSHELRTPVNGMLGMASLLEASGLDDHQREVLDYLQTAGTDLQSIIERLLDFSRISVGSLSVETSTFDLSSAFDHSRYYLNESAREMGVRFEFVGPSEPTWIVGDRQKLNQIFVNLVNNAIKFSADYGRSVKARVELNQSRLSITVGDTGPGIPKDKLDTVFDPFFRVEDAEAPRTPGLGLGLPITRQLAELLGGSVHVDSTIGEGTEMSATVHVEPADAPLSPDADGQFGDEGGAEAAESAPAAERAEAARPGAEPVPAGGRTSNVLIVEDEAINRLFFAQTLRKSGFRVHEAGSVSRAMDVLGKETVDAIFMDVGLPGTDGITGAQQIRELGPDFEGLPIIALTAFASDTDRERVIAGGMTEHLSKPVSPEKLVATVRRFL